MKACRGCPEITADALQEEDLVKGSYRPVPERQRTLFDDERASEDLPYLVMPGSIKGKCSVCGCPLHRASDTSGTEVEVDGDGFPHTHGRSKTAR